jgi:5-methylcytosine-specific restriction endonuclease McrA
MAGHRRPEIQFTDAPRGQCRWCGEAILYESGEKRGRTDLRRRWHSRCVEEYNQSDPSEARKRIRRRDRGRCRACKIDTYAIRREMKKIGRGRTKEIRQRGFKPKQSYWELDHIVPLIDGGGHGDDNLQTLCTPCHKEKTAEEARRRAEARRCNASTFDSKAPPSRDATGEDVPARLDPRTKEATRRPAMDLKQLLVRADEVNERVESVLKNF